jgi:hypothetical protein
MTLTNIGAGPSMFQGHEQQHDDFASPPTPAPRSRSGVLQRRVIFHPGAGAHARDRHGDGLYSPQAFSAARPAAGAANYEASGGMQAGHQLRAPGNTIFATWFTYDTPASRGGS